MSAPSPLFHIRGFVLDVTKIAAIEWYEHSDQHELWIWFRAKASKSGRANLSIGDVSREQYNELLHVWRMAR